MSRHRAWPLALAVVAIVALAGPTRAADTIKGTLSNAGSTLDFANCTSGGQYSFTATSTKSLMTVALKKLQGVADTDQVPCTADDYICIMDVTAGGSLPVSLVVHGEVKNATLKIKRDFCRENPILCAPSALSVTASDLRCYQADAGYAPPISIAGSNACEGVVIFGVANPASALVASSGITAACP